MAAKVKWQVVRNSQSWIPEEVGDTLEGVLIGRRIVQTKYGASPQVEIANIATGEVVSLFTGKAALRVVNRIPEQAQVRIRYLGEKKIPGRKTMMDDFEVQIPHGVKLEEDFFLVSGGSYSRKEQKRTQKGKRT